MSRDTLVSLALAGLTLLLFAQVRDHAFVNYDDPGYVFDPHVQRGLTLENVRWAFTTFQFANYHPITWLSHMADVEIFGNHPAGHHLVSVALHALNVVVLYLVLRAATGRVWESVVVAALWAVHPLRVESVAWVAERKDLLSCLFFLLSIGAYVRYARGRSAAAYATSLVCFALGLMSKSMVVTLPCVLLLLDAWPLRRDGERWGKLLAEKVPFFALSLAIAVLTVLAQRQGGAMEGEPVPAPLRLANAFAALAAYLRMTVWPTGLVVFYPYYGVLENTAFPTGRAIAGVILLLAGTAFALLAWRRERAVLIGWLWFLGTLVPVIGLVQVGRQAMADRYTYIPHIGLFVAVVWGAAALLRGRAAAVRAGGGVAVVVAILALSARTIDQLRHWRDSGTLFTHAMRVTPRNPVAHGNLGQHLVEQGDTAAALQLFFKAMEIVPRESGPHYHAGRLLAQQGRHDEAERHFREAIRLEPDSFVAHYDLAVELAENGRVAEALPQFEAAVRLKPDSPQAHFAYSLALRDAGRLEESRAAYQRHEDLARRQGVEPLPIPATNPDNRTR